CLAVALAAPVELAPAKTKTVRPRRRLHRGDTLGHHLVPDAVPGDHRDPITLRHGLPSRLPSPSLARSTQRMRVVERTMTAAQSGRADNGTLDVGSGTVDRTFDILTLRKACRDRRGQRATGAVGVARGD